MMKIAITVFIFLVFISSSAVGCFCYDPDLRDCVQKSDYVFIAKFRKKTSIPTVLSPINESVIIEWYDFEVLEYVKGYFINQKVIPLFRPAGSCFEKVLRDTIYLVFAERMGTTDFLQIKDCPSTSPISYWRDQIHKLDSLKDFSVREMNPGIVQYVDSLKLEENRLEIIDGELIIENKHLSEKIMNLKFFILGFTAIIIFLIWLNRRKRNYR